MHHLVVLRDRGGTWEPPDASVGDAVVSVTGTTHEAVSAVRHHGPASALLIDVRLSTSELLAEIATCEELRDVPVLTVTLQREGVHVLSGDPGVEIGQILRAISSQ